MKELYRFNIEIDQEVDEVKEETIEGKTIKTTEKVIKKVPSTFILKKPSRHETDELRLFYGASIKRASDKGLFTKAALISKHINSVGSLLSQETAKRISELVQLENKLQNELTVVNIEKNEGVDNKKILNQLIDVKTELQAIESSNGSIFGNTAESYASERTCLWLILHQTYIEKAGKPESYFKGEDFEKRDEFLNSLEEGEDKLYKAAGRKINSFWAYYSGGLIRFGQEKEDFKKVEDFLDKEEQDAADKAEPAPEPVKAE